MPREPFIPFEQSIYRPVAHPIPKRGVAPDRPQEELGNEFLASALNFLTRDGRVHKREGFTTRVPPNIPRNTGGAGVRSLFEFVSTHPPASATLLVQFGTDLRYAHATSTAWTSVKGSVTITSGPDSFIWTTVMSASAGQQIIGANPRNPPIRWNGNTATTFTTLTTAVLGTCTVAWRNHLLLGDTTDTADGRIITRVHWSRLGDPATWTGTASAGSLDLNDANASRVLAFVPLRTTLVTYKEEAAHALIYKTAPFYFTQTVLHPTLSLIGRRAVTAVQNGAWHALLTKEGIVMWDGQTVRAIGRDRVDRTILRDLNWASHDRIWAAWWSFQNEILFALPTDGATDPNRLWIYNLTHDAWWETDLRSLFAIPSYLVASPPALIGSGFSTAFTAEDAENVWRLFSGTVDSAELDVSISASLQTGLYDYGSIEHKGIYKMAVLAGPASSTQAIINVSKAGQENPTSTPIFASSQAVTVTGGAALPKIDFRLTDRWIAYRVVHNTTSTCELTGLAPYLTERTDARKRR